MIESRCKGSRGQALGRPGLRCSRQAAHRARRLPFRGCVKDPRPRAAATATASAPPRIRTPRVTRSPLTIVTSSISIRTIRLRSRCGVSGSLQRRRKSEASARMRSSWRSSSRRRSRARSRSYPAVSFSRSCRARFYSTSSTSATEPVLGVGHPVTAPRQVGLFAETLNFERAQPVGLVGPLLEFPLNRGPARRSAASSPRPADPRSHDQCPCRRPTLAAGLVGKRSDAVVPVIRDRTVAAAPMAHPHLRTADPAQGQALEQGRALAHRTAAPLAPERGAVARTAGCGSKPAETAILGRLAPEHGRCIARRAFFGPGHDLEPCRNPGPNAREKPKWDCHRGHRRRKGGSNQRCGGRLQVEGSGRRPTFAKTAHQWTGRADCRRWAKLNGRQQTGSPKRGRALDPHSRDGLTSNS